MTNEPTESRDPAPHHSAGRNGTAREQPPARDAVECADPRAGAAPRLRSPYPASLSDAVSDTTRTEGRRETEDVRGAVLAAESGNLTGPLGPGGPAGPAVANGRGGNLPGSEPAGEAVDPAHADRGAARIRGNGPVALLRLVRRREIAFAIVGGVNTAMGIGLTVAWLALLGDSVPPSVGVVAAYVTGIGVAFVLHRRLVFRVHGRVLRDFLGFAAVNCGGLVVNAVLLEVAVSLFGFPRALSAVVVMGVVAAGTFFGHQYISFRRPAV